MFDQRLESLAYLKDSRNAVLIHSCGTRRMIGNLEAPYRPGVVTRGLELACMLQSMFIYWGNGSGWQEKDGVSNAELMQESAVAHANEIVQYINRHLEYLDTRYLYRFIEERSVLDTTSRSKQGEISFVAEHALKHGCKIVFHVHSIFHIEEYFSEAVTWSARNPEKEILFIPISAAMLSK